MSNNAKVGGVLTVISGALGVIGGFFSLLIMLAFRAMPDMPEFYFFHFNSYYYADDFSNFVTIFYAVIGISQLLLGTLGIAGGVFALQKKQWGLALAGAIASCFTFFPCGVPAIIFVAMAKPEFPAKQPSMPPV